MTVYGDHCAFNMSKSDLYYADLMVLVIIASFFHSTFFIIEDK